MAYYDSLIAIWPTLDGTTEEKIATLTALTENDTPWWQANKYASPISVDDVDAAGLLSQKEINARWPNRTKQIADAEAANLAFGDNHQPFIKEGE